MDDKEILEKLEIIFRDVLGDNVHLVMDSCPDDVEGWDSLTHILILQSVQDEFQVEFSIDEIMQIKDVKGLVEMINGKKYV